MNSTSNTRVQPVCWLLAERVEARKMPPCSRYRPCMDPGSLSCCLGSWCWPLSSARIRMHPTIPTARWSSQEGRGVGERPSQRWVLLLGLPSWVAIVEACCSFCYLASPGEHGGKGCTCGHVPLVVSLCHKPFSKLIDKCMNMEFPQMECPAH